MSVLSTAAFTISNFVLVISREPVSNEELVRSLSRRTCKPMIISREAIRTCIRQESCFPPTPKSIYQVAFRSPEYENGGVTFTGGLVQCGSKSMAFVYSRIQSTPRDFRKSTETFDNTTYQRIQRLAKRSTHTQPCETTMIT